MPWNKEDYSFKTLINRRVTSSSKSYYEEFGAYSINVHNDEIWSESIDSDPAQAVIDGTAQLYTLFTLTEDVTVASQQCYYAFSGTRLEDWISEKYGSGYRIKIYDNSNNEIFPTDASQWFFNYQTGILTFNGSTAGFSKPFKITGYRYIGTKGSGGGGGAGSEQVTRTYYVDKNRTDTYTENGSVARPYKTIAGALSAISGASSSDRYQVYVFPGEYSENLTLKSYVDIIGIENNTVKIIGDISGNFSSVTEIQIENITIDGDFTWVNTTVGCRLNFEQCKALSGDWSFTGVNTNDKVYIRNSELIVNSFTINDITVYYQDTNQTGDLTVNGDSLVKYQLGDYIGDCNLNDNAIVTFIATRLTGSDVILNDSTTTLYIDNISASTGDNFTNTGNGTINLINTSKYQKYDNTTSGLAATNTQDAIDEVLGKSNALLSWHKKVLNDVDYLYELPYDVQLTTTGAGDLQTAINGLSDGDILEVATNATYNPITINSGKAISIRVADGYAPVISGDRAIKLMNGAENVIISGFTLEGCTNSGNTNYEGSAITFGQHQTIVKNITFDSLTMRNNTTGGSVMLSYHWSVSGDNYANAPTLSEMSEKVAFINCHTHKASDNTGEVASISVRGINQFFVHNCKIDNYAVGGRGIQMQACINVAIETNEVYNCLREAIKIDQIGTMVGYKNSGTFKNNRVKKANEGIDIDDVCGCLVMDNKVWDCTIGSDPRGISLDDTSMCFMVGNVCWNNTSGITLEASSVASLKKNICFNNTTDFEILNGYTLDDSNSTSMEDSFVGGDNIPYDNTSTGLSAQNVQDAIDELFGRAAYRVGIVPNGTKDGVNDTFTLPTGTYAPNTLGVFLNGVQYDNANISQISPYSSFQIINGDILPDNTYGDIFTISYTTGT